MRAGLERHCGNRASAEGPGEGPCVGRVPVEEDVVVTATLLMKLPIIKQGKI